jgi:hypothetical protein
LISPFEATKSLQIAWKSVLDLFSPIDPAATWRMMVDGAPIVAQSAHHA